MKGHNENYPYRLNSLPPTHINSFTEILLLRQYWEARTLEIILAEVRRVEHSLMDGISDLLKHTKTDMTERWQGIGGRPEQDLSQPTTSHTALASSLPHWDNGKKVLLWARKLVFIKQESDSILILDFQTMRYTFVLPVSPALHVPAAGVGITPFRK